MDDALPRAEAGSTRSDLKHPSLTARWLRDALSANRAAFEREMRRERRLVDERFERYWREASARQS